MVASVTNHNPPQLHETRLIHAKRNPPAEYSTDVVNSAIPTLGGEGPGMPPILHPSFVVCI